MKRIGLLFLVVLSGCGGVANNAATEPTKPTAPPLTTSLSVDLSKFQTCTRPSCDTQWVSQLHIDQWFWSAGTIYAETVMPLASADSTPPHFSLWRPFSSSASVLEVSQWVDGKVLTPGTDYYLSNQQLVIPQGSRVKLVPHDFPFVSDSASPYANMEFTKSGGPLLIGDYESHQLQVTYVAASLAAAPQIAGSLPKYNQKLAICSPVAISYFGDSIQDLGRYPIAQLVGAYLSTRCPGQIYYRTQSTPGYGSSGAATAAEQRLNDTASDVIILAFGMNDASSKPGIPATEYQKNIASIIATVRAKAPSTEFVLVATPEGNPDWAYMSSELLPAYRDALIQLTQQLSGVAMVDVTDTWRDVIASKSYYDVTLNGVNHPNDFGLYLYSQSLLKLLANIP